MTNYSRSVLKSNGPHRSKNLPVKFGFSSKSVPANIAKKLPSQRCSQPFLIVFFNFSHKWPTFALTPESGYYIHTRSSEKDRTQRLTRRNRGRFRWGWYHYPRSVPRAAETLDVRLPKGLICRFLRSGGHHWFQRCKMCPAFYKSSSSSRQTAPVPCERDRSCFFVTSWSVPGTRRSARGCRWRWDRTCRCRCRW